MWARRAEANRYVRARSATLLRARIAGHGVTKIGGIDRPSTLRRTFSRSFIFESVKPRAREELLAIVAHDLRNPIHTIRLPTP